MQVAGRAAIFVFILKKVQRFFILIQQTEHLVSSSWLEESEDSENTFRTTVDVFK